MSTVLNLNLGERQELKLLEKGEYEFVVLGVKLFDFEEGGKNPRISVRTESPEQPQSDDVYHTLWWPKPEDTDKNRIKAINRIADFVGALGLDVDVKQINIDDWTGCTFRAIVDIREDDSGNEYNYFKKIIGAGSTTKLSDADPDEETEVVGAEEA